MTFSTISGPGLLRRFLSGRSGNVATMFAFGAVPLILMVGIGVDYTNSATTRSKLNALADAAALEAVSRTSVSNLSNQANTDNGEANAKKFFDEQAKLVTGATVTKSEVKVTRSLTSMTAKVTYTGYVPNSFGGLIGSQTTAIGGSSTSTTALPPYIDFYMLLDNSPSMGIGATQADIDAMIAATKNMKSDASCAFACHDLSKNGNDYYALAKQKKITMRIDVVRDATQQLVSSASATELVKDQFRMAIYTFSDTLVKISDLSADLDSVKTNAAAIDLQTIPYQNYNNDQYTNIDGIFPLVNTAIPAGGDGYQAATPQKWLFFVSDGVADENLGGKRTIKPVTAALCATLKARGIQIAALYTTYYPLPTNGFYNSNVAPWAYNIGPSMQTCATPGFYFEVGPNQGISQAMQALFQKAVASARLTQ